MDEDDDRDFSMLVKNLTGREFQQRQKQTTECEHEEELRRSNRGRNDVDWDDSNRRYRHGDSRSHGSGGGTYQNKANRRFNRNMEDYRSNNTGGKSMEDARNRSLLEEENRHNGSYEGVTGRFFSQQKKKHQEASRGGRGRDPGNNSNNSWFRHGGKPPPYNSHQNRQKHQVSRNGSATRDEKDENDEDEDEEEEEDDDQEEKTPIVEEETIGSGHSYHINGHSQDNSKNIDGKEEVMSPSGHSYHVSDHNQDSSMKRDGKEEEQKNENFLSDHTYHVNEHNQNSDKKRDGKEEDEETVQPDHSICVNGHYQDSYKKREGKEETLQSAYSKTSGKTNGKEAGAFGSDCMYVNREEEEKKLHCLQQPTPSVTTWLNSKQRCFSVSPYPIEDRTIPDQNIADNNIIGQKLSVRDLKGRPDRSFISCDGGKRKRLRSSAIRDYPEGCGRISDISTSSVPAISSPGFSLGDDTWKHQAVEYLVEVAKCSEDRMCVDLGGHKDGLMNDPSSQSSKLIFADNIVVYTKKLNFGEAIGKQKLKDVEEVEDGGAQKLEEMEKLRNQELKGMKLIEESSYQKLEEMEKKKETGNQNLKVVKNMGQTGIQKLEEMKGISISAAGPKCIQDDSTKQHKSGKEIMNQKPEEMERMENLSSVLTKDIITNCTRKLENHSVVDQVFQYISTEVIVLDPEDDSTDSVQAIDQVSIPERGLQIYQQGHEENVTVFPSFQSTPNVMESQSALQDASKDSLQVNDAILIPETSFGTCLLDNDRNVSIFSSKSAEMNDGDGKHRLLLKDKEGLSAKIFDSSKRRLNITKKPKVHYIPELKNNVEALIPMQNNSFDSSQSRANDSNRPEIQFISEVPNSSRALVPFVNSGNMINKGGNDEVKLCSQRARSRINHAEHSDASVNNIIFRGPLASGLSQGEGMSARALVKRTLHEFESLRREYVKSKDKAKSKRSDLEAGGMLRQKGRWQNHSAEKIIGEVPGVEVGDQFSFRIEMLIIGLHRQLQGGIDYIPASRRSSGMPLATSIVASGGYEDDKDSGDKLIYSGQGGNNYKGDKRQGSDQSLVRGNLAMSNCMKERTPVRVIRGTSDPASPSSRLYTYDGLYDVVNVHFDNGAAGFGVYQFTLIRRPGQPQLGLSIVQFVGNLKKKGLARPNLLLEDISQGQENWPVCVVNEVDGDPAPTNFTYIPNIKYPKWFSHVLPQGCDCEGGCSDETNCSCVSKNGGELPYNEKGYIIRDKKVVYECGSSCRCSSNCSNRVSQKGLRYQLEVFKTKNRGWGVRSVNPIQPGGFICEYTGELLSDAEAEQRVENDEYLFELGNNCNLESTDGGLQLKNMSTTMISSMNEDIGYTIDAKCMGNVARFINHSCSPNLFAQNVLYDSDDLRFPHVMLFAMENIPPMRELTYDYNYTVGQVLDASGNIKSKACYCGASDCKGRLY